MGVWLGDEWDWDVSIAFCLLYCINFIFLYCSVLSDVVDTQDIKWPPYTDRLVISLIAGIVIRDDFKKKRII